MKIASKSRLSLRKLFTALLAVGPLAVLPSPVWAVLPTSSSFTATSGTVSLSSSGTTVNINFSDRAILTWGVGTAATQLAGGIANGETNFNVGGGETWNFASTGSVLNKVTKGTGVNAAIIDGALIGSAAKVFILADGGIVIGGTAQLNTQNLILSTVPEIADQIFLTTGDLTYQGGAATGAISFGGGVTAGGNVTATASGITFGGAFTSGADVVLRSVGSANGIALPASTVAGNLTITTANGSVTQNGALSVGAGAGTQTATFNVGTGDITLQHNSNNFDRLAVSSGKNVNLKDANIVTLGASTISGDLTMKVGGAVGTTAISTDGAVAVTGNVNLDSSTSFGSGVSIGNNSSVGGYFSAKTAGGSVSLSAVGNLTLGNITNTATATKMDNTDWTAPVATAAIDATGVVTVLAAGVQGSATNFSVAAPAAPIYSASGPSITFSSPTASAALTLADVAGRINASTGTFEFGAAGIPITPTNFGAGYDPATTTVTVVGGGGLGATAVPTYTNGAITSIRISGGAGYTTLPTILIQSPKDATAAAATGTAVMNSAGQLTGITVNSSGSGYGGGNIPYTAPTITLPSQAASTASVTVTTNGTVKVVDNAVGALSSSTGFISSTVNAPTIAGKYAVAPSVTVNADPITGLGTGATATATIDASGAVTGVTIINPGQNYNGNPTFTFGGAGQVGLITLTNPIGSGYTTAPTVTFSAPTNSFVVGTFTKSSTAKGTAIVNAAGQITGFVVTDPGSGYTATPTITLSTVTNPATGVPAIAPAKATDNDAGVGKLPVVPLIGDQGFPLASGTAPAIQSGGIFSERNISITGSSIDVQGALVSNNTQFTTTLTASGPITINKTVHTGRVVINSTAGDVSQTSTGLILTRNNSSSFTASGNISLNASNLLSSGNATAASASITAGNASLTSANNFVLGNANVTNDLTISTVNNRSVTLGVGGTGSGGASATRTTVGGVLTVNANGSGSISDNNDSSLTATGGMVLNSGSGAITLDAATFPGAFTPSILSGAISASTTGTVILSETTTLNLGRVSAGNLTASSVSGSIVDSGPINVSGTATFTVSGNNNVVLDYPVTAATTSTPASSSAIAKINLEGGANNSITELNGPVEVLSINNATGTTTIGTAFGATAQHLNGSIKLGNLTTGNLSVNSGGFIDIAGFAQISGNLSLTANGVVPTHLTLGAAAITPVPSVNLSNGRLTGLSSTATGAPLTTYQMLTFPSAPAVSIAAPGMPLASLSVTSPGTGYLQANSKVIISGGGGSGATASVTVPAAGQGVGTVTAVNLTNPGSGYTTVPTVTIYNTVGGSAANQGAGATASATLSPSVAATATTNLNAFGQITGYNVTNGSTVPFNGSYLNTSPSVTLYSPATNAALTDGVPTKTSVVQTAGGVLKVGGTTTIQTSGDAVLFRNNDFNNVVLANSAGGGVILNDINNVSVSGNSASFLSVTAGSNGTLGTNSLANVGSQQVEAGAWGVTLGNLNVDSLTVVTSNGGNGNSGRIAQASGATIFSRGTSAFTTTNNSITLANNGNSFGRVQLTSGGGAITLVEDGTIRLGSLSSAAGTVTLTSRTGSIIEDNNVYTVPTNTTLSTSATGNVTLNAASGSVVLGGATQPALTAAQIAAGYTTAQATTGSFAGRVNVNAPDGAVSLSSSGGLNLGTINANSLVASAAGELTQAAAAKVYGSSSFTSSTGNIAITNEANNFGRISVTGNAGISIVENGTLNLGRVTMPAGATGNFSATSVNGDIIDSGLNNVILGGTVSAGAVVGVPGTGVVSLTAANGNVTLDDPTTEFPTTGGVVFNAKNVTLSPLGRADLVLGATGLTATAQNLSVSSATGVINNNGPVTVTGDASFQTGNKAISLTNSGNAFGTVRFSGAAISITEADSIHLVSGSSATGAASFNSVAGGISIVDRGGVITLNSTGLFTAVGAITLPKLIQANGTLTLSSAGTKDLSALSLSGDLAGKAPVFIGAGTNVDPKP